MIDDLDYNNVLNIIEYLNVIDSSQFASTSTRYFYLVQEYRRLRGAEVVTVSSWDHITFQQRPTKVVISRPLEKIQTPPNLILAFNTPRCTLEDELPKVLPPHAIVLGVCADTIQVNLGRNNVESFSNSSVMYASFPNADILPFSMYRCQQRDRGNNRMGDGDDLMEKINEFANDLVVSKGAADHWKSIIVHAAGDGAGYVEQFVRIVQSMLPNIAIVGGICDEGYITRKKKSINVEEDSRPALQSLTVRQLRQRIRIYGGNPDCGSVEKSELVDLVLHLQQQQRQQEESKKMMPSLDLMEDSVFGIVLGGDVPVRSIVSRGVTSITTDIPQCSSPYVVQDVRLLHPTDDDFFFRGRDLQPIHMIHTIQNKDTGGILSAQEMIRIAVHRAEFIGVKRPQEDGFELHMFSSYCQAVNALMIMTDGSDQQKETLVGAEIDFFSLNGEACCRDMDHTVNMLRNQTQGEEILGALMFCCAGRGPNPGPLLHENMADATRFAKVFPDVPCLGFYAGGEIGPLALAGNQTNVFRTGKAALQGFTTVFCLFIVPVIDKRQYELDDSPTSIRTFINKWRAESKK